MNLYLYHGLFYFISFPQNNALRIYLQFKVELRVSIFTRQYTIAVIKSCRKIVEIEDMQTKQNEITAL